ncbi:MAG: nitric-oxide reductase large subunit [Betaproteobacteria bacterium]|nr:MAG: nitric-oxide reductase large subunit [Betaproteobacteria bacterium]
MQDTKRLWKWLGAIFLLSFAVLGWLGREIYLAAPPIANVQVKDGPVLFTAVQVEDGQRAWRAAGGQQLGSVWGHGAYVAPDWSADWLHREAIALRGQLARKHFGADYGALDTAGKAAVDARVKEEMRANTFDAATNTITVSRERAAAIGEVQAHYMSLFGADASFATLREQYAMPENALPRAEDRRALAAFFFWSAWSAATDRPGEKNLSYTSNWPHEPLVGNEMTTSSAVWSMVSIILLIAGIAAMVWYHGANRDDADPTPPQADPLLGAKATPSMLATRKYFFTVIGLFLAQIGLGAVTAHYAVEGTAFFGLPISEILPYTVSRTIHTQYGIFWIATAWLATGLYIAPLLSGHEPKLQKLGVNVLFWALIAIVVGSTATGWLGALQRAGFDFNFWFGAHGLEFTAMGRFWQILLFVGLLFWLFLLGRALWPALKRPSETRGLIAMVFLSATCIGLFYAASLTWGQRTHYAMVEYWRWWLVHLWVEGFFEVFATAVIALIFTRLGLVRATSANRAIVAETIVFLFGGILGTLHHLYWTGTPTSVIAVGAVFSALEVVPLALLGLEGWHNYQRTKAAPWVQQYRWPILFFIGVSFWNTVGAGLLGFAINPPASLYFVQGLNLTPAHGHAALFGVYGMLGIGLMLFCLRGLYDRSLHADRLLGWTFWGLNAGLAMMVFMSLVPAGIVQAIAAIDVGLWYARSPEIIHSALMRALVWLRVPGDVVFAAGGLFLAVYAWRLLRKPALPAVEAVARAA